MPPSNGARCGMQYLSSPPTGSSMMPLEACHSRILAWKAKHLVNLPRKCSIHSMILPFMYSSVLSTDVQVPSPSHNPFPCLLHCPLYGPLTARLACVASVDSGRDISKQVVSRIAVLFLCATSADCLFANLSITLPSIVTLPCLPRQSFDSRSFTGWT